MKYSLVIAIIIFVFVSCNTQKNPFVGEWEIIEFAVYARQRTVSFSDEKLLREQGAVWDLDFKRNGSFKQQFNMRQKEKMETEEGSFEFRQDSLFIHFSDVDVQNIRYSYLFNNDTLTLEVNEKLNQTRLVTRFRKK